VRAALARSYADQAVYERQAGQLARASATLERAGEAWQRAIEGAPAGVAKAHRGELARARLFGATLLIERGETERALGVLAEVDSDEPEVAYYLGTGYALASVTLGKDPAVPLPVREKRAEAAARAALLRLERARAGGHFDDPARVEALWAAGELKAFRARPDFAAWAKKLKRRE
jgi:hypothetical protein